MRKTLKDMHDTKSKTSLNRFYNKRVFLGKLLKCTWEWGPQFYHCALTEKSFLINTYTVSEGPNGKSILSGNEWLKNNMESIIQDVQINEAVFANY